MAVQEEKAAKEAAEAELAAANEARATTFSPRFVGRDIDKDAMHE